MHFTLRRKTPQNTTTSRHWGQKKRRVLTEKQLLSRVKGCADMNDNGEQKSAEGFVPKWNTMILVVVQMGRRGSTCCCMRFKQDLQKTLEWNPPPPQFLGWHFQKKAMVVQLMQSLDAYNRFTSSQSSHVTRATPAARWRYVQHEQRYNLITLHKHGIIAGDLCLLRHVGQEGRSRLAH